MTTAVGDEVLVLAADHCENALLFRIRRAADNKVYLHGHDSDTFPAATLDALSDGLAIDVACFDCTNGPVHFDYRGHMDADDVIALRDELLRRRALTPPPASSPPTSPTTAARSTRTWSAYSSPTTSRSPSTE